MTINTDIDKLFKKGLADYSEKPPVFIWDSIEKTVKRKEKLRRRNFVLSIAASSALLISFGAGYLFTGLPSSADKIVQSSEPPANSTEIKQNTIPEVQNAVIKPVDAGKSNNAKKNKDIVPTGTNDSDLVPAEAKESELLQNEPIKEPKVKKAKSMGALMPPSFGDEMVYQKDSLQESHQVNSNSRWANTLDRIEPRFPVFSTEYNIIYNK